ncbi:AsmA-like C-terminal region-containing protein [Synoicihabitans lomoniglobus]|uniref:AsmA-like C-terminal region-containing protein n=1 Tax=Synoicihabitans lomoniglobus TaxID=2909285 RepID=A0AAF0CP88_9BACT|nr:AsmA-like C-terminal region-containing protein [Opitutaceae bacterium LMO-M01]WED63589.1 AsmA-like C-terminal region-containing protein [Opitutaceae bacterium LMO-M01]
MTLPRWLQVCWKGTHFGGRCVFTFLRWTLWLVLGLLLCIQLFIASAHELTIPNFVLRQLEQKAATAGLRVAFGGAAFDPGGHVLLRDVRLTLLGFPDPMLRADVIHMEVDPIALWLRRFEPRSLRISGARLMMPAMLSPSGTSEPIIRNLDTTIRPGTETRSIFIDHLTARLGPLPLDVHGELLLPASPRKESPPLDQMFADITRNYVAACRFISQVLPRIPAHEAPHLSVQLTPHATHVADADLTLTAEKLVIPLPGAAESSPPVEIEQGSLSAVLPLGGPPKLIEVHLCGSAVSLPEQATLAHMDAKIGMLVAVAARRFEPRLVDLSARSLSAGGVTLEHVSTRATVAGLPQVQAELHAQLFHEPLQVRVDLDALTRAGRVRLDTHVANEAVAFAGQKIGFDLPSILSWDESPPLHVDVNLGPGGKPLHAEASFETGAVVARYVPLDATAARVRWEGTSLLADEVLLVRGDSRATGRYLMDTKSLDFRFLLRGHLQPADIDGWFRDWWSNFWRSFQFPSAPPEARVEVSGRWKAPLDTQVWIQARGESAVIKDIALNEMSTRLFIRPGWADVLEFHAVRPVGEVQGSFTRQWKLPEGRRWTLFEVHAQGVSDTSPLPKLLGPLGEKIIAPLEFDAPLHVTLDGRVEREDEGAPMTSDFAIDGRTSGAWRFKDFPLQGADFKAHYEGDRVLIDPFSSSMAQGVLNGRIELSQLEADQQIAFDLNLENAHLGETITTVEAWTDSDAKRNPTEANEFRQRIANGALSVSLTAQGPAADPFGFQGQGNMLVENANLGELKLLGILSTMLGGSILNFSKLQLENAYGDFQLKGPMIDFSALKVTGPRGALDATGHYSLETNSLAFLTRVRPFEGSRGLLDTVFTPLTNVLEVKLAGKLNNPEWTFVYGPTNILRSLSGGNRNTPPPESENAAPSSNFTPVPPSETSQDPQPTIKERVTP